MEWISVKDRWPSLSGNYLVFGKSNIGSIIEDCDWFDTDYMDWWRYPKEQVIYWMPMPDPPIQSEAHNFHKESEE